MSSSHLLNLPSELLAAIFEYLSRKELAEVNRSSKVCRALAAPLLWKHVDLIDCRAHTAPDTRQRTVSYGPGTANHSGRHIPAGATVGGDEHDDMPIIKKLYVLATQPWLAASVESVTHRCHLTPPDFFTELPRTPFSSQTLSMDPRTIRLVRMAVRNMTRVHTLRIVFGHPKLTEALLRCFFDEQRERENPVKKLWLENVRIVEGTEMVLDRHKYGLPLRLSFEGVEVVRFRRLPLNTAEMDHGRATSDRSLFVYSRGGEARELQNGLGGNYLTSTHKLGSEIVGGHLQLERALKEENRTEEQNRAAKLEHWPLEVLMGAAMRFDDTIYEALPGMGVRLPAEVSAARVPSHHWRSILAYRDRWPGPVTELSADCSRVFRCLFRTDVPTAAQCAVPLFQDISKTLTSLTIDWALVAPDLETMQRADYELWIKWYADLFSLRCPHLKAFQYRNAVAQKTLLPPGLYLFDHSSIFTGNEFERDWVPGGWPVPPFEIGLKPLEFFEAHPNLQCLSWPMDQFFSHAPQFGIAARVRDVIFRLGQRLVDLRVDAFYTGHAEPHSDDGRAMDNVAARKCSPFSF
jgi:hypothetical protein